MVVPLSALVAAALACTRPAPAPAPAADEPVRLVVLVVIDQWPTWGFAARRDLYRGGLGRLLREGVVHEAVEYPYAITYTAPGHATLGTGAPPAVHGILANDWWRREQGRRRQAEADDTVQILGLPGRAADGLEGASGRPLRVDGVADWLRTATGGRARSVVIGGKARAATLVAGRRPDVVLWYEAALPGVTTSTAYADALPPWLLAFDRAHPMAPLLEATWTARDPALLAARTGLPDDAPGEGAEHGLGIVFPHRLATSTAPARALHATPFLDRLQLDLAIAAVAGEGLGRDDVADLLVVSLSAHDYVGHNWGQESWETLEHELALDVELARFWAALDREVGAGRYAVVVTSDHGATPLVEHGRHPGARRIPPAELEAAARAGAASVLGEGDWIAIVSSGMIYLSPAAAAHPERARALDAIAARVAAVPQVQRVIALDPLPAGCAGLDDLATRACWSRVPGESGELLVVPTDGSLITRYTTGTSHDAISPDNDLVPVLVLDPRRRPLPLSTSILSVAPTLATLLDIPTP